MIREAMVFHYLDDLDSKIAAVRVALATPSGDDEWSSYSSALGRKFLKLDAFLKSADPAATSDSAASTSAPEQLTLNPDPTQKLSPLHPKTVIPTGVSRRFFLAFAPANASAHAVEEPLFDLSAGKALRVAAH